MYSRCCVAVVLLCWWGCGSAQQQDILPAQLVQDVIQAMPGYKTLAMNLLRDTLMQESDFAQRMRKFGRNGSKRGSFRFVQGFLGLTPHGKHISQPAFVQSKTMAMLRERFQLNNEQVKLLMPLLPSPLQAPAQPFVPDSRPAPTAPDVCPYPRQVQCIPQAPYRTYDGTCNNLRQPLWGASHMPLVRFLHPQYGDVIEAPRVSARGLPLPSARLISSTVHWDIDIPHHIHTLMTMQFGQFLDHDLSRTAITKLTMDPLGRGSDLEEVECGFDGCQTVGLENQACLPIPVPFNDTDFVRQPCLMFVRSLEVPNADCTFGPREQLNQLTSHLDSSHIYGSDLTTGLDLRDLSPQGRGRLKMKPHPGGPAFKDLLPDDAKFKDCKGDNTTFLCFKAGDGRVNEFMGLTTLHMVWARQHNHIVQDLQRLNPHWNNDRLYEEGRRIINALWQNIVYSEYLPVILGSNIMSHYRLNTVQNGHWNDYDDRINPSVSNVFATAAMRFGHTQIQGTLEGKDVDYSTREFIPISTQFRRPHLLYRPSQGGCDAILRGLIDMSTQSRDPFITKQVTRHLFADEPPFGLGEDLMSLNIQRGREHGLPGYNGWRQWCGLPRARSFEDLLQNIPRAVVNRLKRLYEHVDDIDLWPAAVSEISYPDSTMGPVFSCILATQFRNLKFGDRYWFENNQHNPHPFSDAQLSSIKQVTLSQMICSNTDSISHIQKYVLLHPLSKVQQNIRKQGRPDSLGRFTHFYQSTANERVPCEQLPRLDLRLWQEQGAVPRPPPQPRPGNPPPHLRPGNSQSQPRPGNFVPPPTVHNPPPPPQFVPPPSFHVSKPLDLQFSQQPAPPHPFPIQSSQQSPPRSNDLRFRLNGA